LTSDFTTGSMLLAAACLALTFAAAGCLALGR
jgi:hypothetical protein